MKRMYTYIHTKTPDILLICLLFALACVVYLYKVELITPGMFSDEISVAHSAEQLLASGKLTPFINDNLGHATLVPYLVGISIKTFGRTITAIRLPSILFGALDVVLFFLLLRLFLNRFTAGVAALLLLFSYPLIVVSRLAYEITASLFFQILSILLLVLAYKTKKLRYGIGFCIALAAGLYTYIGFRTFVVEAALLLGLLVFRLRVSVKKRLLYLIFTILTVLTVAAPLLVYGIEHPPELTMRSDSLWLFGQGLPVDQELKELGGATIRLDNLFTSYGDPDFRQNPAVRSMFDLGAGVLALCGIVYLWKKNRAVLFIALFFTISPIINDILSFEPVPEFHYYGIGHPNTLRISGIIPIVYFLASFGLEGIYRALHKIDKRVSKSLLIVIVGVIIGVNWHAYYDQRFNEYIYDVNGVRMLTVSSKINANKYKHVYMSPVFINDPRVWYFTKNATLLPFTYPSKSEADRIISKGDALILDPYTDKETILSLADEARSLPGQITMLVLNNPVGITGAVLFTKSR